MQIEAMNRDGKSVAVLPRLRIYGQWEGPFRRANPLTGKRGWKYFRAMARPMGSDNQPMEILLQSSFCRTHAEYCTVDAEIRKHSDGSEFICAYLAPGNTVEIPGQQDWEVIREL